MTRPSRRNRPRKNLRARLLDGFVFGASILVMVLLLLGFLGFVGR